MWGGLLAGAIEGASKAAYNIADEQIKNRDILEARALDRKEKSEDRITELETEMRLKEEFANRLLAKENEGFRQSKELAPEIGRRKDAGLLANHAATNVAGDAPAMSQDEIAALLKEHPEYRSIYEKAGYMPRRRASDELDLQVEAAGEVGAPATVRKELTTAAANASKEEKAADELARKEKEDKRRGDQADERIRQGDKRLDAMIAHFANSNKEKPPSRTDVQAVLKDAEGVIEKILTQDGSDAVHGRKRLESLANSKDPDKAAKAKAALQKIAEQEGIANAARARLQEMTGLGAAKGQPTETSPKPASTAKPSSGPKKGDTKQVVFGPNKGKTAVFDGTGWTLAN